MENKVYSYDPSEHTPGISEAKIDLFPPAELIPTNPNQVYTYDPEANANKQPWEINKFTVIPPVSLKDKEVILKQAINSPTPARQETKMGDPIPGGMNEIKFPSDSPIETQSTDKVADLANVENNIGIPPPIPPKPNHWDNVLPVDPVTGIIDNDKLHSSSQTGKRENLDTFPPVFTGAQNNQKNHNSTEATSDDKGYNEFIRYPNEDKENDRFSNSPKPQHIHKSHSKDSETHSSNPSSDHININEEQLPLLETGDKHHDKHLQKSERLKMKAQKHETKQIHYREERRIDSEIVRSSIPPILDRGIAVGSVILDAAKEFTEAGLKKLDEKRANHEWKKAQKRVQSTTAESSAAEASVI